jgi:hypothetical protein
MREFFSMLKMFCILSMEVLTRSYPSVGLGRKTHGYKPSFLGGGDRKDGGSRPG